RTGGDAGPGLDVDLLTLEEAANAAARGLTEGPLTAPLEQQARALPPGPLSGLRPTLPGRSGATPLERPRRHAHLPRAGRPLPGLPPGFFPLCGRPCVWTALVTPPSSCNASSPGPAA